MRYILLVCLLALISTSAHAQLAVSSGGLDCSSGACAVGSSTATGVTLTTDGASLNVEGTTTNTATLTAATTGTAIFEGADAASPANTVFTTTGAGTVTLGDTTATAAILTTDGMVVNVEGTAANTLTLTTLSTDVVTIIGADAAGAASMLIDTTGAGTISVGSVDVLSVPIITDGGTVTIDGYVQADAGPFIALDSGALTANSVHLAGAAGDYVMPACEAANVGDWVTVVVKNISEVVVLQPASGDTLHPAGAVIDQDHEMDSAGAATSDGDFVTLVCITDAHWYSTAIGGAWIDGEAS